MVHKLKIGIIGGAGYTAGELLRLLIHHPTVEIAFVHSSSNAGKRITDIHEGLIGESDLTFADDAVIAGLTRNPLQEVDALFLCSAHGDSRKFLEGNGGLRVPESSSGQARLRRPAMTGTANGASVIPAQAGIPSKLKIIDLSMDYRHQATADGFVYGLPELNKAKIQQAQYIANPGCFATAIQLALLPLADKKLLTNEVHVHAITGSTGAGVKPGETTHFSWRDNNISTYKVFEHQHLKEVCESLQCPESQINFIPVRGDFPRGIFATAYTETNLSLEEAVKLYQDFYRDAAFTFISDKAIDLKQAVNTNKCILHLEKHGTKLLITSVIDNLLKGASGQAVQNFNLLFGLDEKAGLGLKPSAF
ncbi:MAG: N-acetyl-gamma-glutamyl-phosphate reductase [Candidatus Symbiothrix sp.]|nr:N-acetyl-gamma-glutamyl-phosphate reductase [Candidatus Symbiothrix sp.]